MNEQDYEHKMEINQIIRTVMANKKPSEIEGILYYQDQIIEIVNLIRADEREACAVIVSEQYEGFSKEHQGVQYVKQRILEAIRARGNK